MKTTHVHSCKKRCVRGGGAWGRRRFLGPELADELSDKSLLFIFWLLDDWGSNIINNFFDSRCCESKSVRLKDKKHSKILFYFSNKNKNIQASTNPQGSILYPKLGFSHEIRLQLGKNTS